MWHQKYQDYRALCIHSNSVMSIIRHIGNNRVSPIISINALRILYFYIGTLINMHDRE